MRGKSERVLGRVLRRRAMRQSGIVPSVPLLHNTDSGKRPVCPRVLTLFSLSPLCARSNSSTHENGHDKNRVLDQASVNCFGVPRTDRRALSFHRYVAVLGATR